MKTRIISALVGTVFLLSVLFCPYTWVFTLVMAAASAIAVWELLHNTGFVKNLFTVIGSMVFSALLVLTCAVAQRVAMAARPSWPMPADALLPAVLILLASYAVFMLLMWFICRKSVAFTTFGRAFLLMLYATVGFSALAALRAQAGGAIWFLLVLIIPWMSDTGAYFTGMLFGKHKMAPVISPKKTWEGFFGGWIVSIGSAALFAVICNALNTVQGIHYSSLKYAIIAAVLAPISVCGDLFASWIKRRCGIKDYGNLMPGHGGVMDRFDSVLMIAPLLYLANILFG